MTDTDDTNAADDEEPSPGAGGPRLWLQRHRWWVAGGLLAIAAVVVGIVILASDDDEPGADGRQATDRPMPTPPPAVGGDVDEEGQEFLDLLERGHQSTYHATYVVSGDPEVIGTELRLDVWRRDGLVRQDMFQQTETSKVETASFLLADDEAIACQRLDEGEWSCARQASGDEFTAAGLFGAIARELEGADVVVSDEEVADRPARCFTLSSASGEVSQCMDENGVPLRRRGDGAELILVDLSDDVPDDTFTPPAEPASGG